MVVMNADNLIYTCNRYDAG